VTRIKFAQLFVTEIVLYHWHKMTRKIAGHSYPCSQSPLTTTKDDHH